MPLLPLTAAAYGSQASTLVSWLSQMAWFTHGGLQKHTAAQDGFEPGILLPQPLGCWDPGYVPPHPRNTGFFEVPFPVLSSGPRGMRSRADSPWPWCRMKKLLLLFLAGWAG